MRAAFIMLLLVSLLAGTRTHAEPTARLEGVVTSGGKPLKGATVMVNRAWPITGLAYYCPGCYLDCGKSATTGADGTWAVTGLDTSLKFELLVVAKGHVPQSTPAITPARNIPVEVDLKPRDLGKMSNDQIVRGRVLNLEGRPIKGAVVSPEMVLTEAGGCFGACDGLDPLAVTDEDGSFALTYSKPCTAMDLTVSARGFAHMCFPGRVSGGNEHELRVVEGTGISGRLVRNGAPVRDVTITLAADQTHGHMCFERQEIATDADGNFAFANVLPAQTYVLTASTAQLGDGCTDPKVIRVEKDAEEIAAGDLNVVPGVRVAGHVLPPPGGKLPAGAKLMLSSELGWDSVVVDLPEDGAFVFPHVPRGRYSMSLTSPGVFVSHRNRSVDKLNSDLNMLVGRIDSDISGMEIETTTEHPKRPERGEPAVWPELAGVEKSARPEKPQ